MLDLRLTVSVLPAKGYKDREYKGRGFSDWNEWEGTVANRNVSA